MSGGLALPIYGEGDKAQVTGWRRRSRQLWSRPEEGSYRDKVPWFQERLALVTQAGGSGSSGRVAEARSKS